MTDADYAKTKRKVEKYLDKWRDAMGLGWYHIHITWDRSYAEKRSCVGETNMNRWQYREADIIFYLPRIAEEDDKTIEQIVVHELCHVLLAPISVNMENLNDAYQVQVNELATEMVTKALVWVRKAGEDTKKSPKKSS